MDLLSIPGYAEALLRERLIRDASFLGVTESIGPFEVQPMTLRHWMVLRVMGSPFFGKATPKPEDLWRFLWVLSPEYTPDAKSKARARFLKRCQKLFYPPRYLPLLNTERARRRHMRKSAEKLLVAAKLVQACRDYASEAMMDQPPAVKGAGFQPDFYSDAAFFCARFAREYHWRQEDVLDMPIKRLFQYWNEMKQASGSKVPLCNPSDQIRSDWMREVNKQRKEQQ